MSYEKEFVDLVKEGKISDAISTIKEALTQFAGESIVEKKYAVAETYGMKKREEMSEEEDEDEDDEDKKKKNDDDEEDDMDESKKKISESLDESSIWYVLEVAKEGVIAGKKPIATVKGVHNQKKAKQEAENMNSKKSSQSVMNYVAEDSKVAEKKYELRA